MFIRRRLLHILSIIVILTMMFSVLQLPPAYAQGTDGLKRQINAQTGKVSFLGPERGRVLSAARALGISAFARPADPGMALAQRFGSEFGLTDPAHDLTEMKTNRTEDGRLAVRYQQSYQGVPVIGGELNVNTNENGDLYSMNGEVSADLTLQTQPTIDSEKAKQTALQGVAKWYEKAPEDFLVSDPELWIYDESLLRPSTRPAELVWRIEITPKDTGMSVRELVLVNAQRGNISLHFNQVDTTWIRKGSSETDQDIDPTPTPSPTETASPTETSIPSETPLLTETPSPAETSIPTETTKATATLIPTEEISTRETPINEVATSDGATWYVKTTGNDSNSCNSPAAPCLTINAAINKAAAGNRIQVAVGTYAPVTIAKNLTLSGGWDNSFGSQTGYSTVQGSAAVDAISSSGTLVSISRFVAQNSKYGIYHTAGALSFDRGALINNRNGIYNLNGDTTFTNTTISGNSASGTAGSAISDVNGTIRIQYSTITNNSGWEAIRSGNSGTNIIIGDSILAGNPNGDCDVAGTGMTSTGHNIFGRSPVCSGSSGFVPDPTDQVGVDPQLSALFPVGYHPVSPTSLAIDRANPASCPATDQRGVTRPQGTACDIGAYEYMPTGAAASFGIASGSNQRPGPSLPLLLPLSVYVMDAAGNPVSGVTVTFTAPASGPSGTFADSGAAITTASTNAEGIAVASIFTANSQIGSYTVNATVDGLPGSVSFALTNAAWFVSSSGSNGNSCNLPTSPCLTINGVLAKAGDGDAVKVAMGTYAPAGIYKSLMLSGGWDANFSSQTGYSTANGISVGGQNVYISRFVLQNSDYGLNHVGGTLNFDRGTLIGNNNGIYNRAGDVTFTNTTISSNHSSAISNASGTIRIYYSTITNNTGSYAINSIGGSARIIIGDSILAGNVSGDCYVSSTSMTSAGHNIFGRSPICSIPASFVPDPTDQVGVDPQLSILLPGGYHAVASTSPAVDHANLASCPATDQPGVMRPQGAACDIGAYEYTPTGVAASFGIVSGSNQRSGPSLPFPLPLAVFVIDASGNPVSGATVTFTAPASGPGGTFADTGTNTTSAISIMGLATSSVFTANSQLGSYNVTATVAGLSGSINFALLNAAWFVSPTGSNASSCALPVSPCLTINGAIAKAAEGDAILVAVGSYPRISITKSLTLLGGWDTTFTAQIGYSTVGGDRNANGISVGGPVVYMSRFIVQNSYFGIQHGGGVLHFEQGALINNSNGLYNYSGDANFTNTTISGNYVRGSSVGGFYAGSAISNVDGLIRIQYSTITNNGGTEAIWGGVEIRNSILAGNPGGNYYLSGANITFIGHNVFDCSTTSCGFTPRIADLAGGDLNLLPLFPNGYHLLLPDSPAIDAAGPLDCPSIDQRGVTRPAGIACDIGAVEYTAAGTTPRYVYAYQGSPQIIMINSVASSRLTAIVFDDKGNGVQGKKVTFTGPDHGASVIFADTGTNTSSAVTDVNGFATSPVFSANHLAGSYFVAASVNGADTPAGFSLSNSAIAVNPKIRTYTANNYTTLPGTFLCDQTKLNCTNGQDVHADAAHKYAIGTYDFYAAQYNRDSIDNEGMTITSTVHFYSAYENAAWTGSQMIYGDGDGFSLADDVVAHELTHGVTQHESSLFYFYQSGAINESFSDLWGEYYDQTNGMGNDSIAFKWQIGEDISGLGAIRSFGNPPDYGDPDKMSSPNYYTGTSDNGGVHSNSGVNNKAVFLMVQGGSFNGKTVASIGWDKTAAIYYEANTNLLSSGADYSDLYYALQQACANLIGQTGITSADCIEVKDAIDAVEMNGQPIPNFNTEAPYCDPNARMTTFFADDLESGIGNWTFNNGAYTRWQLDSPYGRYAHSGEHFLYADDFPDEVTDASAQLISIIVPNNAYLRFAHTYDFDTYEASAYYYDGGVLEYSLDGGSMWNDAGPLIDFNGYKGTLRAGTGHPLQGRSAFVGASHGYISTRLNLASLAGETVAFRWRIGLDQGGYAGGWWVDDVEIYQCQDISPVVSSILRASVNPTKATSIDFTVTFSEPVVDVDKSDFTLSATGSITDAAIENVTGSGATRTVTVNTGYGNGTLRLDVPVTATIQDLAGNPLGNLPFTGGQSYTIEKPVVGAGVYDDTDPAWIYMGTWASYTGPGPYNNSLHYISTAGSYAELTFTGAKFILIFTKDSNRGSVDVYVDGSKITTINAYSASLAFQQIYTSPLFASGTHTVRFVHAGGQPYIDIDAIRIVGTPVPVGTYDDAHAAWSYLGSWASYSGAGPSANTLHYTSTVGDSAELTFTGTKLILTFTKDANRGAIDVFVDGNKITTLSAYSASLAFQQTYTSPSFASGTHTVRLVHAGGSFIDIDAIQIVGAPVPVPVGAYDDAHTAWSYSGSWASYSGAGPYADTLHYTSTIGDLAELTFTGTKFILTFTKDANRGSIDVFVDGNKITTINANSATLAFQQTYTSPSFASGTHTVSLVHAGGSFIDIDGIQIVGAPVSVPVGTYDDAHAAWSYSGSWASYTGSGPWNNTLHYTNTVGDSAELTFTGTQFNLRYTKDANRGLIDVYVDGDKIITLNAYSASLAFQQMYSSPTYTEGMHTVRLVHAGGSFIDIDAIQIVGTPVPIPAGTYDDGHAAWSYSGSWANYNGAGPYANTLHYTSTVGDLAELTFTGTKFILTFTKDSNRGLMDVYVDGTKVTTIDAYSASLTFQQTYTSPAYSPSTHTVRFVHVGGQPYIDIDAITILP